MANETDEIDTSIAAGRAEEVDARIAAITSEGGMFISVRVTVPADKSGPVEVEITHT